MNGSDVSIIHRFYCTALSNITDIHLSEYFSLSFVLLKIIINAYKCLTELLCYQQ